MLTLIEGVHLGQDSLKDLEVFYHDLFVQFKGLPCGLVVFGEERQVVGHSNYRIL